MDYIQVLEFITLCITIFMMSCGIPPVLAAYKARDLKGFPLIPFVVMEANCIQNVAYGLLAENRVILIVNVVGTVLMSLYLLVYVKLSTSLMSSLIRLSFIPVYLVCLYMYLLGLSAETRVLQLGLATAIGALACMVTPALEMVDIIKTGSVQLVSSSMLLGAILNPACWLLYGIVLVDYVLIIPNAIGLFISLSKLCLVIKYRGRKHQKKRQ